MSPFPLRPTWAEIDLAAVAHNVRQIQDHLTAGTRLMAIVKANGYGHGAVEVARAATAAGVSFLGVGMVEEAAELRDNGLTQPILILGFTPREYAPYLFEYQATPTVFTREEADAFSREAVRRQKRLDVHVKVDTGMGRVGCFPCEEADRFICDVNAMPGLKVTGLYTHFASADHHDKTFARRQLDRFLALVRRLEGRGITGLVKHAANSAGAIDLPEAHLDMVRLGISLYGLYPSDEVDRSRVQLRPVMTLKSRLIFVKNVPAGTGISYGSTYVAKENETIATLPVGYGDGYRRLLSNRGEVLIRGRRAPVVGRVCMDQTMIRVCGIPDVKAGDVAVLFGQQDGALLHADEVARWLDTINYEVVTAVSYRVPRVYLREG